MRAYGVRGAHWEAKIVFFKIKWFFGMTRCHACLRNSVLYPKMRLGRHMYQCWVLAAKPRFRWHAVDFSVTLTGRFATNPSTRPFFERGLHLKSVAGSTAPHLPV